MDSGGQVPLRVQTCILRAQSGIFLSNGLTSSSKNDLLTWDYITFPSVGVCNSHSDRTPFVPRTLQRERISAGGWVPCI